MFAPLVAGGSGGGTNLVAGDNITLEPSGDDTIIAAAVGGGIGSGILKNTTTRTFQSTANPHPDIRRLVHQAQAFNALTSYEMKTFPVAGIVINRFAAVMFYVNARATLASLLIGCTSGSAGTIRCGIYSCYADGVFPQTRIWDSGAVDVQSAAAAADLNVGIEFGPGWYFYGATCSTEGATSVFARDDLAPDLGHVYPFISGDNKIGWYFDHVPANALPAIFPTSASYLGKANIDFFPSAFAAWTVPA